LRDIRRAAPHSSMSAGREHSLLSARLYDANRQKPTRSRRYFMRMLAAMVVMLLTTPLELQAAETTLGTCAASVGAWEFIEGGRAVIARDGDKYHALWLTTF